VHANLAGLEAVAAALKAEGRFDRIVVAGDHLQGGPRPLEVWRRLRDLGWTLLLGNEDEALVSAVPVYGAGNYQQAYLAQHAWSRAVLPPALLAELGALPFSWRETTPAGDLLVVHSSPRSTTDRCGGPHNAAPDVLAAYGGTGASAVAFGHYHLAFVRPMPIALLINVASVGLPLDRKALAAYTVLCAVDGGWVVEQRRVAYDPDEEVAAALERGLPPWTPDPPAKATGP
jgi:hypothetical protein